MDVFSNQLLVKSNVVQQVTSRFKVIRIKGRKPKCKRKIRRREVKENESLLKRGGTYSTTAGYINNLYVRFLGSGPEGDDVI